MTGTTRHKLPCAPAANPGATARVTVFHNVQITETGGQRHHAVVTGYRPGHALVRVFEAELSAGPDPVQTAGLMARIANAPVRQLSGRELEIAGEYRSRDLRSVLNGDVIAVGEIPLARTQTGWEPVTGAVNITDAGEPTSRPLPRPRPRPLPRPPAARDTAAGTLP